MNDFDKTKQKVNEAEHKYEEFYSKDQKHVLDKIHPKLLNFGKLQLLEFNKIRFDSFLLLLMFKAFANKNLSVPKFEIRPQGRATWIGVKSRKKFDVLLKLGFPMKLL